MTTIIGNKKLDDLIEGVDVFGGIEGGSVSFSISFYNGFLHLSYGGGAYQHLASDNINPSEISRIFADIVVQRKYIAPPEAPTEDWYAGS